MDQTTAIEHAAPTAATEHMNGSSNNHIAEDPPSTFPADSTLPPQPESIAPATKSAPSIEPPVAPVTNNESGITPVAPFIAEVNMEAGPVQPPEPAVSLPTQEEPVAPEVAPSSEAPTASEVPNTAATSTNSGFGIIAAEAPEVATAPTTNGTEAMDQADAMDTTVDAANLPHHPPVPDMNADTTTATIETEPQVATTSTEPAQVTDQVMADAPAPSKVREREEDEDESAPSAKRAKTDDEAEAPSEFKVPAAPAAQPVENGTGDMTPVESGATHENMTATQVDADRLKPMTRAQKQWLLERLRNTKKVKHAALFLQPVDPVKLNLPTYLDVIKEPRDLGLIEENLKNDKYATSNDFLADFALMVSNAITFNGEHHTVSEAAKNLHAYFKKGLDALPKSDEPDPIPKKKQKPTITMPPKPRRESRVAPPSATAASPPERYALQPDGMPMIRRDSSAADGRPKREIHRPPPRDLPYSASKPKRKKHALELKFSESILNDLMKQKYAKISYPFMYPVDPVALNIPMYHKIIKKPMDLSTVSARLKQGEYQKAEDFRADVKLIFQNCYKFNPETDDVHRMGKEFEKIFDTLWETKQTWLEDHAPASEPQSPASDEDEEDDEEEEEEEEDEDDKEARLKAISEQIALLNQQAQSLLKDNSRRKSSPKISSTKKAKKEKPSKPKKSASISAAAAKPSKPKKPTKLRPITFEEKQEISETIGSLDEKGMSKAVQIIRNGCPHLKDKDEEEMELDIDQIPNEVLHELLKFSRQLRPKVKEQPIEDDDDEYEAPKVTGRSAPTKKKNKPMGKVEQETKIQQLRQQLAGFKGGSASEGESPPKQETSEDDDDDESASESEEE